MGLKHWILPNNHFKTHLFFFQFLGGRTLFSSDPGLKCGSNLKALLRSHLTSVRGPISYRICFMARRSFFFFSFFPLTRGGEVRRLVENSTIFFLLNPSLISLKGSFWPTEVCLKCLSKMGSVNFLTTRRVLVNKDLLTGTVPFNKELLTSIH